MGYIMYYVVQPREDYIITNERSMYAFIFKARSEQTHILFICLEIGNATTPLPPRKRFKQCNFTKQEQDKCDTYAVQNYAQLSCTAVAAVTNSVPGAKL